ncbi:MAG: hypothetical protein E7399_09305 [Ruminococcaceae bacterium]|nr:hypothetical protein [Oscillospiraceae bacterium]
MQRNFYQTTEDGGESVIVPQTIEPEPVPVTLGEQTAKRKEPTKVSFYNGETKKFFDRFCVDDVILIAVILLLITDAEVDVVLLVILGFLLLNGME